MPTELARYRDAGALIAARQPVEPVYCLHGDRLAAVAGAFNRGFPGRTMFAVKANPSPHILRRLIDAGIRTFDTASVPEMRMVHAIDPDVTCFFMAPVRLPGAALEAYSNHQCRHFVVDHQAELDRLIRDLPGRDVTIFVRLAAHNDDATYNLSEKFGTDKSSAMSILNAVTAAGMVPALAFNVGSLVRKPDAYARALGVCGEILRETNVPVRMIDVGGGFPRSYPGMPTPPVTDFFDAISAMRETLELDRQVELLSEPGRALVADGMSLVTRVIHRDGDRLFINDGIWGSMMEPWLSKGDMRFPVRAFAGDGSVMAGGTQDFHLLGPTCDACDQLPVQFPLPTSIDAGDYIEFGTIGAYSNSGRTKFNGFYPHEWVDLTHPDWPQTV